MSCIYLDTKILPRNVSVNAKNTSEVSAIIGVLNDSRAKAEIKLKDLRYKVYAVCNEYAESIRAKVINNDVSVTAYLVCTVGPRDYYYLLVDDGFLLTVNGEYFMVERDESV